MKDIDSILNHILRPLDNLVLIFPRTETMSEGWLRAWAFRIASVNALKIEYTEELNDVPGEIDEDAAWNNGGYGAISRPEFNSSTQRDDYLWVPDEYPFMMYHYAMGVYPELMRVFKSYNGTPMRAILPDEELVIGSDNHDFIDYEVSPYEDPSIFAQDIITKNIRVKYGFHNNDNIAHRPSLKFLGAAYSGVPYADPDVARKIVTGKIPRHVIPVFGLRGFTFAKPTEWPAPIELAPGDIAEVFA